MPHESSQMIIFLNTIIYIIITYYNLEDMKNVIVCSLSNFPLLNLELMSN